MKRARTTLVAHVACAGGCKAAGAAAPCDRRCVGCEACVAACPRGAVSMVDGVAVVDRSKCTGCGLCASACPRDIIQMIPVGQTITVRCSNTDKGPVARKICTSSCIACGMCEKKCPAGAIKVVDGVAKIDPKLCICCGMCAVSCPRGVIHDALGIMASE